MTSPSKPIKITIMVSDATSRFWQRFLNSQEAQQYLDPCLYEEFIIGKTKEEADAGAKLVLDGLKIATSSHPSEFSDDQGPPFPGALSVLLDGSETPVAIVETLEVSLRKLNELDEKFARDYGEWDRTLETLQSKLLEYHGAFAQSSDSGGELELLCERFRVVFRQTA